MLNFNHCKMWKQTLVRAVVNIPMLVCYYSALVGTCVFSCDHHSEVSHGLNSCSVRFIDYRTRCIPECYTKGKKSLKFCRFQSVFPGETVVETLCYQPATSINHWLIQRRMVSNSLIRLFPVDKIAEDYVRQVPGAVFSKVQPTPLKKNVQLVAWSTEAMALLDMYEVVANDTLLMELIAGNFGLPEYEVLAHRYGGHQFGVWAGQLGDGRAAMIGEYINNRGQRWELQLKGSGKTPYSRRGDGRAVLRSSVREFLASEAMFHLSVPTSRAVGLVVSDETVVRDQFYDGNPRREKTAVVLRLAPSWFRFGSLEILAKDGESDVIRKMLDYVIETHYPAIPVTDPNRYLMLFSTIVEATADLIAHWTSLGFAHGVMNSDNFSLLSLTIDYGPFGFMDSYDPDFVPNTSDDEKRYSVGAQASVGLYNLDKLRGVLETVLPASQARALATVLAGYESVYQQRMMTYFTKKLGFLRPSAASDYVVALLLAAMQEERADYTATFRQLGEVSLDNLINSSFEESAWALVNLVHNEKFHVFVNEYERLLANSGVEDPVRQKRMKSVNPVYVLRNWMAQDAIEMAEKGDFSGVRDLLDVLKSPFERTNFAETKGYGSKPPIWAKKLTVSCSS